MGPIYLDYGIAPTHRKSVQQCTRRVCGMKRLLSAVQLENTHPTTHAALPASCGRCRNRHLSLTVSPYYNLFNQVLRVADAVFVIFFLHFPILYNQVHQVANGL